MLGVFWTRMLGWGKTVDSEQVSMPSVWVPLKALETDVNSRPARLHSRTLSKRKKKIHKEGIEKADDTKQQCGHWRRPGRQRACACCSCRDRVWFPAPTSGDWQPHVILLASVCTSTPRHTHTWLKANFIKKKRCKCQFEWVMSHACYPSLGETEAGRLREFEDNLTTEYISILKKTR